MERIRFLIPAAGLLLLAACSGLTAKPADPPPEPVVTTQIDTATPETPPSATGQPTPPLPSFTYSGDIPAPEFPVGKTWLNIERPLSLAQDLRGKIVLLDFWTLGCINCIHIIPDLKRLEAEFPDSLVVIGVHSAKFNSESEVESIRQAVLRYDLQHPVINDSDFSIWDAYGARAWPTVFLIDPLGNIVGYHAGEGVSTLLSPVIATMDAEFRAAGLIDDRPLEMVLESQQAIPTILSFPGKVLTDEVGDRLFIADSNHNRIVVTSLSGEIQYTIGTGEANLTNGSFVEAAFNRPQGMALSPDGRTLYIADLENHAVRAADLETRTVSTLAGTGYQATAYPSGKPGLYTPLSSPWDLLLREDTLYIAIAGVHQIWALELSVDAVTVFAGSGAEGIDDDIARLASLAQPSGFTTDGQILYFTDPESSSVRQVPLEGSARLTTIIGTGLFNWGDQDGMYPDALLQHPLGIAYSDGLLYVADTYNNKIKIVDPFAQTSQTWLGSGAVGWQDGPGDTARFAEPSGLSIANGKLYIADTNNHLVRVADLKTGEVTTLVLSNLKAALPPAVQLVSPLAASFGPQTVGTGPGQLEIVLSVPEGYKFNAVGPFSLTWTSDDVGVVSAAAGTTYQQVGPSFPIRFDINLAEGETILRLEATAFYCETGNEALCLVQDIALEIPIVVSSGSVGTEIVLDYELPPFVPQ